MVQAYVELLARGALRVQVLLLVYKFLARGAMYIRVQFLARGADITYECINFLLVVSH
jgi:hypothetical protein